MRSPAPIQTDLSSRSNATDRLLPVIFSGAAACFREYGDPVQIAPIHILQFKNPDGSHFLSLKHPVSHHNNTERVPLEMEVSLMKDCKMTMESCRDKVTDVVTKMKNTDIRCDFGMNLELVNKNCEEGKNKQWKTQKNCSLSLFDLAIAGTVILAVMAIGSCMGKKKCKSCKKDED